MVCFVCMRSFLINIPALFLIYNFTTNSVCDLAATALVQRLSDRRICIGGLAFFSGKTLSTLLIRTTEEIYAV